MLRDYQIEFTNKILEAKANGNNRVLATLPTGGGKTICFVHLINHFLKHELKSEEKVLVVAHRTELIEQAKGKIQALCGLEPGIIKAGFRVDFDARVQVASVATLATRITKEAYAQMGFKFVIIDEAHHAIASSYLKLFEVYKGAFILGVTATPIRLNGKGFEDLFDCLVQSLGTPDLIERGYLSKWRAYADIKAPINTKGVRTSKGDYNVKDLEEKNDFEEVNLNVVGNYQDKIQGKRCLVFAIDVAKSRAIAQEYNKAGIKAIHLDGNTASEARARAIADFTEGKIKVICNVGLFTEGTDIPQLDAVQIVRPTKSLALWLQMVGRVLRTAPDKELAYILDHTDNWYRHGLPDYEFEWSLEGVKSKPKGKGEGKKKVNSTTGEIIEDYPLNSSDSMLSVIEGSKKKPELKESDIEDTIKRIARQFGDSELLDDSDSVNIQPWIDLYERFKVQQQTMGYKKGWLYHRLVEYSPPYEFWQYFAAQVGYHPNWAWYQYQRQQRELELEIKQTAEL